MLNLSKTMPIFHFHFCKNIKQTLLRHISLHVKRIKVARSKPRHFGGFHSSGKQIRGKGPYSVKMSASIASETNTSYITLFYALLLTALVLSYAYWKISRRHLYELLEQIPGPPGLPLFGNAFQFIGASHRK